MAAPTECASSTKLLHGRTLIWRNPIGLHITTVDEGRPPVVVSGGWGRKGRAIVWSA